MTSRLYGIPLTMNDGTEAEFGQFEGKAVMVVNVASKCGHTKQYAGLEELYGRYRARGFEILGVPCNQFGGQEPGEDADIAEFCSTTYGVTFPLAAKSKVVGKEQHPLYAALTAAGEDAPQRVKWNFEKFLVGRDGSVLARFPSAVGPDDAELIEAVEDAIS